MSAVVDAVSDVVGDVVDVVGDVAADVVQVAGDAIQDVGQTLESTVQGALDDPIGTIATVTTAVYAPYALPAVSAGRVIANGGDLDDALKSAAISYAAQGAGQYVGGQLDTAAMYGTDLGSQQTAMLAAQNSGLGLGTALGGAGATVAGAATGAALSGGDVGQAVIGALGGYGARLGMNLGLDAAGRVINQAGDVIADSFDELKSFMGETYGDQPGDFPLNIDELREADRLLGQFPSFGFLGDQEGDFPLNEKELAEQDALLGRIPAFEQYGDQEGDFPLNEQELAEQDRLLLPIGDQPGDFPLNEEELAAADEELAKIPSYEQYGDQPGDYDTTEEERLASEEILAGMPDADTSLNLKPVTNYLKEQYKNSLLKNLFGGNASAGVRPFGAAASALSGLGGLINYNEEDDSFEQPVEVQSNNADLDLFNPVGDSYWAPQTKIGGLGAAGKYVNQEQDTFYINPEQAKKEKQGDMGIGWETPIEDYQEYQEDPYFDAEDIQHAAQGGPIGHNPEFFSEGGAMANRYVKGGGNGTSDSVPAMLATGEFVIPADVVSGLGNGDNDAGAKVLDEFMKTIRKHKRAADPSELPPDSKGPLSYLEVAYKKVRK